MFNVYFSGNFGLKDQVLALKWVKENIASFGGSPDEVTIFGESAGAASIGYHLMSSQSEALFKRAILESGSATCNWAFLTSKEAKERSSAFLDNVNCKNDHTMMNCLQMLPTDTILTKQWVNSDYLDFNWMPSVDEETVTDNPVKLIEQGKVLKKDVLLGVNKDEGSNFLAVATPPQFSQVLDRQTFMAGVDFILYDVDNTTRAEVIDLYEPDDGTNYREALYRITGDRSLKCPVMNMANLHEKLGSTFLYLISYRPSNEIAPEWMGVLHGSEIAVSVFHYSSSPLSNNYTVAVNHCPKVETFDKKHIT